MHLIIWIFDSFFCYDSHSIGHRILTNESLNLCAKLTCVTPNVNFPTTFNLSIEPNVVLFCPTLSGKESPTPRWVWLYLSLYFQKTA